MQCLQIATMLYVWSNCNVFGCKMKKEINSITLYCNIFANDGIKEIYSNLLLCIHFSHWIAHLSQQTQFRSKNNMEWFLCKIDYKTFSNKIYSQDNTPLIFFVLFQLWKTLFQYLNLPCFFFDKAMSSKSVSTETSAFADIQGGFRSLMQVQSDSENSIEWSFK